MAERENLKDRLIKRGSPRWEEIVARLATFILLMGTPNSSKPSK